MTILQVQNLKKTYNQPHTTITALNNINFSVKQGEFIAVTGASGSGKSTLMHLIGGVERPTSGTIVMDGYDVSQMKESELAIFRRRNIAMVHQFYNLLPNLSVAENIILPCLLDNQKVDEKKLQLLLEIIGLSERANDLPSALSIGEQQKVAVGRGLINTPRLLFADEPTGNLDSESSSAIIEMLKVANKQYQQTLFIITHDEEIARQADRMITLNAGEIVGDELVCP